MGTGRAVKRRLILSAVGVRVRVSACRDSAQNNDEKKSSQGVEQLHDWVVCNHHKQLLDKSP